MYIPLLLYQMILLKTIISLFMIYIIYNIHYYKYYLYIIDKMIHNHLYMSYDLDILTSYLDIM